MVFRHFTEDSLTTVYIAIGVVAGLLLLLVVVGVIVYKRKVLHPAGLQNFVPFSKDVGHLFHVNIH